MPAPGDTTSPLATTVLRLVRLLFVVLKPVETDAMPVDADELKLVTLLFVVNSSLPVTASVDPEAIVPSVNRVIFRVRVLLPTLTTFGAPPSELFAPRATELFPDAVAEAPIAIALFADAVAEIPTATVFVTASGVVVLVPIPALAPIATFPLPETLSPAASPTLVLLEPVSHPPAF
jgi:hypothetical protein